MRAWRVHELGDPAEVLRLEEVEPPRPGPGQLRVAVDAAALNFFDALQIRGLYQERAPLPFTPGGEICGRVVEAGEGVDAAVVGRRVIGMAAAPAGGLAEEALSVSGMAFEIPDAMPAEVGAALFITYGTGHLALHRRARLQAGETLLVHAGAGGVGSAAIQLGVAAGARVLATAGGTEKVELCRKLGADVAIDYRQDDFVAAVKEATGGRGADVVFDPVGGDVLERSLRCTAWEGRVLVIGFTSGHIPEIKANLVLLKNLDVVGVHWGAYRHHEPEIFGAIHAELLRLWEKGRIEPVIHAVLPMEDVPGALTDLTSRRTVGKVLIRTSA
jgi:NADPH2:quinone reductase